MEGRGKVAGAERRWENSSTLCAWQYMYSRLGLDLVLFLEGSVLKGEKEWRFQLSCARC